MEACKSFAGSFFIKIGSKTAAIAVGSINCALFGLALVFFSFLALYGFLDPFENDDDGIWNTLTHS